MSELKDSAVKAAIAAFEDRCRRALDAAGESRGYATDPDSAAESKYDTRTTEASYLAAGQADMAEDLAEGVGILRAFQFRDFTDRDEIDVGALVEAEVGGKIGYYLLAPTGGGTTTETSGLPLTILAPDAPLHQKLLGMRAGDRIEDPQMTIFEVE